MKTKCGQCRYFNGKTKRPRKGFKIVYGECRRFPPATPNIWGEGKRIQLVPAGFLYPEVHSNKWCGEFKPEEKEQNHE